MSRLSTILTVVALLGTAGSLVSKIGAHRAAAAPLQPSWSEVPWPFPMDQWGKGKAFQCKAAECGAEVMVYIRAKIGVCN
jgi:hypothetical protein